MQRAIDGDDSRDYKDEISKCRQCCTNCVYVTSVRLNAVWLTAQLGQLTG